MRTQSAYDFLSHRYPKIKNETKKIVGFRNELNRELALVLTNNVPTLFIAIDPSKNNTFKFKLIKKYEKYAGRHSNLGANAPALAKGNQAFCIIINNLEDLNKFCNWYDSKKIPTKKETLFEKKIYFPIIAQEIESLLQVKDSAHRDEIVDIILNKYLNNIVKITEISNKPALFIAQNMVDWFSAELTKKSEIVSKWQQCYVQGRIEISGREITNFSRPLNPLPDEEIPTNQLFKEGTLKQIQVNAYERNPQARRKCLEKYGYFCRCCEFNFELTYGELGKDFIHVHHITPLSTLKIEYELNPLTDLAPVCANCHAMIHRKTPPYTIEEIRDLLKTKRKK